MKKVIIASVVVCVGILGGFYFVDNFNGAQAEDVWKLGCTKPEAAEKLCWMKQEIFISQEKDGKQEELGRLLTVNIIASENNEVPMLTMGLPLGVNLPYGVHMKVDDGAAMKVSYEQCLKNGCLVKSPLAPEILEMLKGGENLRVSVLASGAQKPLEMEVSLQGFTKAFKKLNKSI